MLIVDWETAKFLCYTRNSFYFYFIGYFTKTLLWPAGVTYGLPQSGTVSQVEGRRQNTRSVFTVGGDSTRSDWELVHCVFGLFGVTSSFYRCFALWSFVVERWLAVSASRHHFWLESGPKQRFFVFHKVKRSFCLSICFFTAFFTKKCCKLLASPAVFLSLETVSQVEGRRQNTRSVNG